MIEDKKDKKNYHIHTNININNTLKGFFLGIIFSIFIITIILLLYLNNRAFEVKRTIGLYDKIHHKNDTNDYSTINLANSSSDKIINVDNDNPTINQEEYKNVSYSQNNASEFTQKIINNNNGTEKIISNKNKDLKIVNNSKATNIKKDVVVKSSNSNIVKNPPSTNDNIYNFPSEKIINIPTNTTNNNQSINNNSQFSDNTKDNNSYDSGWNKIKSNNDINKQSNKIIFTEVIKKDEIGNLISRINEPKDLENKNDLANNELISDRLEDFINSNYTKYTLQIGYFSQKDKATQYASKLSLLKIPVVIKKVIKNNNEYYRIVYQNLSYNKANTIKKLLQKNNINSIIIKDWGF